MQLQNSLSVLAIGYLFLLILLDKSDAGPISKKDSMELAKSRSVLAKEAVNPWNQLKQRMRLFPTDRVRHRVTAPDLKLVAQDGAGDGGGAVAGGGGVGGGGNKATRASELTISIPRFHKNERGDWVYAHWGQTYGDVWRDTRFHPYARASVEPILIERNMVTDYYPKYDDKETVCLGRSTVYNIPVVKDWLKKMIYNGTRSHRPIWTELRRQIYEQGRSEECHSTAMDKWLDYAECALRRNQRMEYLIPKYPLHQLGYRMGYYVDRYPNKT